GAPRPSARASTAAQRQRIASPIPARSASYFPRRRSTTSIAKVWHHPACLPQANAPEHAVASNGHSRQNGSARRSQNRDRSSTDHQLYEEFHIDETEKLIWT